MKKMTLLVCLSLLGTLCAPYSAFATTESSDSNGTELIAGENCIDLEYYEDSDLFDVYYSDNGDEYEIIVNDEQLEKYCKEQGLVPPESSLSRAAGTSKIVGKISSGKFKIYIKKDHLNFIANRGSAGVSTLFGGLPGFVISSIVTYVYPANYKHGRVFVYTSYRYQYWYYQ